VRPSSVSVSGPVEPASAPETDPRRARRRPNLTALVLALIGVFLLVVLGLPLVGHGVLLDVNTLSAQLPFRAVAGRDYGSAITCRTDTLDYYLPGVAEIKRGLLHGHLRTWAPYEVGGAPLASLPNHGFLSPMSWPYWVMPLWLAPAFVKLTELLVGMVGTYLFLRRHRVGSAGSWLAGFVFVTCGFMLAWSNWPHTRVAALIPLLMWATERAVRDSRLRDVVVFAVVLASMLLGGFPAVTLFGLTLAGVYALVRVWVLHRADLRRAGRALLTAVGGLVLGVGLSALQIVPFAANLSTALADRNKGGVDLPLGAALTLFAPDVRGTCAAGSRFGGWNPIEVLGYVGSAAVVLAVVAIASRRRRGEERGTRTFLWVALAFVGLLVWVGGPVLAAVDLLPFYGNNSTTRSQSVFGFLAACLAGIGLDRLSSPEQAPPGSGRRSRRPLVVLVVAVLVLLVVTLAQVVDARRDGYLAHTAGALVVPLLVLALAVGAVAATFLLPSRWAVAGPVVLVCLVFAQGISLAHTMLPTSSRTYFYPTTPVHRFLQTHLGGDRYAAGDGTMFPATSDYYQLRTPVGHEFTDPRWKDLLAAVDPAVQRSGTYSTFSPGLPFDRVDSSPVLDQLSVRYWVNNPQRVIGGRRPVTGGGSTSLAEGERAGCRVAGGPLRGIVVRLTRPAPRAADGTTPTLHVRVEVDGQDADGAVLLDRQRVGPLSVSVPGEDVARGSRPQVTVWATGTTEPLSLAGTGSRVRCSAVRPAADGSSRMRLVHADSGGAVYERLDALPRIRWASRSEAVDPDRQVARLAAGIPTDTVLLDDDSTPAAEGRPARVDVRADDRESIVTDVDAEGRGYLVVADSIVRPGWKATVDGRPVKLVRGNHALAAIPVPAGRHRVEVRYDAPGLRVGAVVSGVSVLVAVGLVAVPWLRRRRHERPPVASTGAAGPGGSPGDGDVDG
jgi:hypothetical protein